MFHLSNQILEDAKAGPEIEVVGIDLGPQTLLSITQNEPVSVQDFNSGTGQSAVLEAMKRFRKTKRSAGVVNGDAVTT